MDTETSGPCQACDGPLAVGFPFVRDPQTREAFSILRCTRCGLGHTSPQPEDLGRYYGTKYHGGRHGLTERLCMARRMRFLSALETRPARLLDFGCGDGGFLEVARAAGWNVMGVELKPDHARAKGLDVADTIEQVNGPFELITLWHSFEHVRRPKEVLEALLPRLAPGGQVIIAVPNVDSLQARAFGAGWFHLDVPRHLFHFTPDSLTRLLGRVGLDITRRWNLEIEIDLFGWTQSLLNKVMPTPNVLFDTLTGRGNPHGVAEVAASVVLGRLATAAAIPLVPLGAGTSHGAVMVFAAQLTRRE
jgi:SAM-dependent methyltransferase